jgi:hypothetical protein
MKTGIQTRIITKIEYRFCSGVGGGEGGWGTYAYDPSDVFLDEEKRGDKVSEILNACEANFPCYQVHFFDGRMIEIYNPTAVYYSPEGDKGEKNSQEVDHDCL